MSSGSNRSDLSKDQPHFGEWISSSSLYKMDATQLSPIRGSNNNSAENNLVPSADLESSPGSTDSSANSSSHHLFSESFSSSQGAYYSNSGVIKRGKFIQINLILKKC